MARVPKDITDGELQVMNLIWKRGRITTPDLIKSLYPRGGRSRYEVVQGVLHRLERKGFVRRNRSPLPHHFEPKIDRDAMIGRHLKSIAEKLCDGSIDPLLRILVNAHVASGELDIIRNLVDGHSEVDC